MLKVADRVRKRNIQFKNRDTGAMELLKQSISWDARGWSKLFYFKSSQT
jgi:hypothetical protein